MDETPRLFANTLSVFESIEKLVRRLLSRAETPVEETPPAEVTETEATPVDESPPAEDTETVVTPAALSPTAEVAGILEHNAAQLDEQPAPERVAEPEKPARFEWRVLWTPKGGNDDKEWEDGYALNEGGGVVAVADGAGDGIFSKLWADLLLKSFVANPIPLDDPVAVEPWIQEHRKAWLTGIRYSEQRWSIQLKIDRSCGAATFVALQLDPLDSADATLNGTTGWTAWAVGDACLFHVRRGSLLTCFPMGASTEFDLHPFLYQSKPLRQTPLAVVLRGELQSEDLIVLATDALAQRLLAEIEAGTPPEWARYWDLDQDTWRQEIAALRQKNAIVNDDCTLFVFRLPGGVIPVAPDGLAVELGDESCPEPPIEVGDVVEVPTVANVEPVATAVELIASVVEPMATAVEPAFECVLPIDEPAEPTGKLGDDSPNEQDRFPEDGDD